MADCVEQVLRCTASILLCYCGCVTINNLIKAKIISKQEWNLILPQKIRLETYRNIHSNVEMRKVNFNDILGHNQNKFKIEKIRISNNHEINSKMVQEILHKMCPNGGERPSVRRKGKWVPSSPEQFEKVLQNIDKYPYNITFDINNDMVIKIVVCYLAFTKNALSEWDELYDSESDTKDKNIELIEFNKILSYFNTIFIRYDMTRRSYNDYDKDIYDHTQFNELKIGWKVQVQSSHYSKCRIIEIDHDVINEENVKREIDKLGYNGTDGDDIKDGDKDMEDKFIFGKIIQAINPTYSRFARNDGYKIEKDVVTRLNDNVLLSDFLDLKWYIIDYKNHQNWEGWTEGETTRIWYNMIYALLNVEKKEQHTELTFLSNVLCYHECMVETYDDSD